MLRARCPYVNLLEDRLSTYAVQDTVDSEEAIRGGEQETWAMCEGAIGRKRHGRDLSRLATWQPVLL